MSDDDLEGERRVAQARMDMARVGEGPTEEEILATMEGTQRVRWGCIIMLLALMVAAAGGPLVVFLSLPGDDADSCPPAVKVSLASRSGPNLPVVGSVLGEIVELALPGGCVNTLTGDPKGSSSPEEVTPAGGPLDDGSGPSPGEVHDATSEELAPGFGTGGAVNPLSPQAPTTLAPAPTAAPYEAPPPSPSAPSSPPEPPPHQAPSGPIYDPPV